VDFYAILGVARSASDADVERAYRRLARRYHPGINPGDSRAAELYEQIQQAYGVLMNAERRRQYDLGGPGRSVEADSLPMAFAGFDFSAAAEGAHAATFSELFADVFQQAAREATTPTRGADIEAAVHVSFADATRGGQVSLSITRQVRCPGCRGQGLVARSPVPCPACGGDGVRRWARGHMVFTKPCDGCEGTGQARADVCRICRAIGTVSRTEVVTIAIPSGIESGARVAVPSHGHAGARGGPSGDLYVTVEVEPHRFFRRTGRDLHLVLPVAVHEAALGARIEVPTLDGKATVVLPPGTVAGQQLRLRGLGVGAGSDAAGDLIVEVQLALPPRLDQRSKELLREFGRLNGADVRSHLWN
jgi:molecular chaperone DnaJ